MLLHDLFEARNWEDYDDPVDRWLAKYTYEGLDRWPSQQIVERLLARYGNPEPQTLYRGLNFRTAEKWEAFIAQFEGKREADLATGGLSSWTTSEKEARQFALVQPTYYPDAETFQQEQLAHDAGEILRGHRGVILRTRIGPHQGIDVNRSRLGHESETLLPSGTYRVTIHQEIKTFGEHLRNGDETPSGVILSITRDQFLKGVDEFRNGFMHHILKLHADALSSEARRHLFRLSYPTREDLLSVDVKPNQTWAWSHPDIDADWIQEVVQVWFNSWFFELAERELFEPEDQQRAERLAGRIARHFIKLVDQHPNAYFRCQGIGRLFRLAGLDVALIQLQQRLVGQRYHALNDLHPERINSADAETGSRGFDPVQSRSRSALKDMQAVFNQYKELQ